MSAPIKHTFVSGKSDGGDATMVRPSNWNAAHDGIVVCYKVSNESFSSTSLADSTDMGFAVVANTYLFEYHVYFTTNATTVGIKLAINGPTQTNIRFGLINPVAAAAAGGNAAMHGQAGAYNTEPIAVTSGPGTGGSYALLTGSVVVTASGTLILRHASETATATTILAGSWGRLTTV